MGFRPNIRTAMVFAAGLGKRMQPLTRTTPKPLIRVAGRTMLDRVLDHLVAAGVTHAVVNTHYLAEQIVAHLATRKDIAITLLYEEQLLETGGGLKNALPHLGTEPIYAINSDIVWLNGHTPALSRLAEGFDADIMDLRLLLIPTPNATGYSGAGDFALDHQGHLLRPAPPRPHVFGGVQILKPQIVAAHPEAVFSLNTYYFDNPRAFGLLHDGPWHHIGTPEALAHSETILQQG